eukprot:6214123-Pleurochrysis_carterae.AAC.2
MATSLPLLVRAYACTLLCSHAAARRIRSALGNTQHWVRMSGAYAHARPLSLSRPQHWAQYTA